MTALLTLMRKKLFSLHKNYKIKYNNSFCIRCDNCVYVTTLRYFQELGKMNGKFNKEFTSSCFLLGARKIKNDTDIKKQ